MFPMTPVFFLSEILKRISAPSPLMQPISHGLRADWPRERLRPCDLGADLSRGFRALKTWITIETFGVQKLGQCIDQTCRLAQRLESWITQSEHFFMRAPVTLNIVCFGVKNDLDGAWREKS